MPSPIKIIQFTDMHLFSDPNGSLMGIKTKDALEKVLSAATSNSWPPHFVLATGDLTHDESEASYEKFKEQFSKLGVPVYCLPGNHDIPALMQKVLSAPPVTAPPTVEVGNWVLILLDSTIPKSTGGNLKESELKRLDETLKAHPDKHVLVTFHHQPVPTESDWLDKMMINNADQFFKIIDSHKNVKGILWGHIHQEYEGKRKGIPLMASPSTCLQFKPKTGDAFADEQKPGYRWVELYADGSIKTGVNRLKDFTYTLTSKEVRY